MSDSPIYPHVLPDRTIRLLTVEPGEPETQLQCTLQETCLDTTSIPYYALSYCWGANHSPVQITCNSHPLPITPNLHSALLEYRRRGTSIPLWADAICIDQSNIPERTSQVRMMQKIYSKADCVVVWLGEAEATDGPALQLLKIINTPWKTFTEENEQESTRQEAVLYDSYLAPEVSQVYFDALAVFFLRPWFSRIWIVQEISSAKKVIIWCGTCTFNEEFSVLAASARLWQMPNCVWKLLTGVKAEGETERQARMMKVGCAAGLWAIKYAGDGPSSRIPYLLSVTRCFDSTDPRDKMFALVGLAGDIDECFVDYSKSYEDIARELSRMIIDGKVKGPVGCVLDLWSFITRDEGDSIPEPSWVVDWLRFKESAYAPMMNPYPSNKLAIPRIPEICFLKEGVEESVSVRGTILDTITHRIPFPTPSLKDHPSFSIIGDMAYYPTGERLYDAFWRTLCCNRSSADIDNLPTDDSGYRAWNLYFTICKLRHGFWGKMRRWTLGIATISVSALAYRWRRSKALLFAMPLSFGVSAILLDRASSRLLDDFQNRIEVQQRGFSYSHNMYASRRQVCITRQGMMGLMPLAAKVGDSVGVFAGCRIPYVLRASGKGYKIVGDAYLHGMMDGEGDKEEGSMLKIV